MGEIAAYYNEFDKTAVAWLRELIKEGHIAPGDVDERDIKDVVSTDLVGYAQCHFFAGIGVWSYALRCAGWGDNRPVWTASLPCQPFSDSGRRGGFDDNRHLWPTFLSLAKQQRPSVCFGEQVSSKGGLAWFDLVQTDMENESYACAALDLCAAGVGAPHRRQRLYWVADADCERLEGEHSLLCGGRSREDCVEVAGGRQIGGMANTLSIGCEWRRPDETVPSAGNIQELKRLRDACGMGDAELPEWRPISEGRDEPYGDDRGREETASRLAVSGPVNGFWADAEWIACSDGASRPAKSGSHPLASGVAERVGLLRRYGNCIVAPLATEFIASYMDVRPIPLHSATFASEIVNGSHCESIQG